VNFPLYYVFTPGKGHNLRIEFRDFSGYSGSPFLCLLRSRLTYPPSIYKRIFPRENGRYPFLHNGTYAGLEAVVRHHLNAAESLERYDGDQLPPRFRRALRNEPEVLAMVLSTLDPLMGERRDLTAEEFEQLLAFLQALTSPSAVDLSGHVPDSVPSGLPVWD